MPRPKSPEVESRRSLIVKLAQLGLGASEIALALNVPAGTVRNDLDSLPEGHHAEQDASYGRALDTYLSTTGATDSAFAHALYRFLRIDLLGLLADCMAELLIGSSNVIECNATGERVEVDRSGYRRLLNDLFLPRGGALEKRELLNAFFQHTRETRPVLKSFAEALDALTHFALSERDNSRSLPIPITAAVAARIDRQLALLSKGCARALIHYYGLQGHSRSTLKQIAETEGRPEHEVRTIKEKGLRRLRHPANGLLPLAMAPSEIADYLVSVSPRAYPSPDDVVVQECTNMRSVDPVILGIPVEQLELSVRAYRGLTDAGILTVEQLCRLDGARLRRMRLGIKTLREINNLLASRYGLSVGCLVQPINPQQPSEVLAKAASLVHDLHSLLAEYAAPIADTSPADDPPSLGEGEVDDSAGENDSTE